MEKEIIGYKFFDKDLKGPNFHFQYEIGKTYEIDEKPSLNIIGFHYVSNIGSTVSLFPETRICKVRILGDIDGDDSIDTYATNKIEILEEIHLSEEDKIRYTYAYYHKLNDSEFEKLLSEDFDLDKFANDNETLVRVQVANAGFASDILINDENDAIRFMAAQNSNNYAALVNDKSINIRKHLAILGYCLDVLVNDSSPFVREIVANQGYGLDILVNDPSPFVREEVARQGYGLDILINDPSEFVRALVARQGYGLDILINDPICRVRRAVVEQGYRLDILINDEDSSVKEAVLYYIINNNPELYSKFAELIKSESNNK